jgi:hypothetical protein
MINAERILRALDDRLDAPVELTLYGRAALGLGFPNPPAEYARSRDVDAVLWMGQAEELAEHTNFWEAIDQLNDQLARDGLYVSHLFSEDQVIVRADWRDQRVPLAGDWRRLQLYRLSDLDLLLSKLMRDDPLDQQDALFIVARSGLSREQIERGLRAARVPAVAELQEQFRLASQRLLQRLPTGSG